MATTCKTIALKDVVQLIASAFHQFFVPFEQQQVKLNRDLNHYRFLAGKVDSQDGVTL